MKLITKFKNPLLILFTAGFLLLIGPQALAQDSILPACVASGNCTLCDMIQTAVNAGKVVLGVIGSLVLLMFVYGGFIMLTSAGKPEQITKGKNILINSVIGLAIIFSSYLVVITVVSVVTGQEWTMATLQGKLTCAPISFDPQDLEGYADLSAHINQPSEGGTGAENSGCTASSACGSGLFCAAQDDQCTGKCAKKLGKTVNCLGKTVEACKWVKDSGLVWSALTLTPTFYVGDKIAILTKSNGACLSNNCKAAATTLWPPGINFGACSAPEEGAGNVEIGGTCSASTDCRNGYCSKAKVCTAWKALGQKCDGEAIDNDKYVCGNSQDYLCDDTNYLSYLTGYTAIYELSVTRCNCCLPGPGKGTLGQMCNRNYQCKSGLVCIANAYGGKMGKCSEKLKGPSPEKSGEPCDGLAILPDTDNSICETGNCQYGFTGGLCQD